MPLVSHLCHPAIRDTLSRDVPECELTMKNYAQCHTERDPSNAKVNFVDDIACLNDNVSLIMFMLATKHVPTDPKDVSTAWLVVDVNFMARQETKMRSNPWCGVRIRFSATKRNTRRPIR